jgi:hypothetical protein
MYDLREAEDRILKAVVETVNKHQHLSLGDGSQATAEPGERMRAIDHIGLERHELGGWIARHLPRPPHLADLAGTRRRN